MRGWVSAVALVCAALSVRWAVSLHPHSGEGRPPMYGDFEAQRHWMEITLHLPPTQWYRNSTDNDLLYWGLDYPPVAAYLAYGIGQIFRAVHPSAVALTSSRGAEDALTKLLMRWSVLAIDGLLMLPVCWLLVRALRRSKSGDAVPASAFLAVAFAPSLSLVDHGHFQYNCWTFALCLAAVLHFARGRDALACVLFTVALCSKQIALYYAPAVGLFALQRVAVHRTPLTRLVVLALCTLGTLALCFAPFLSSREDVLAVLERMFPFGRGVFEDKVANFWCSAWPLVRVLRTLPPQTLLQASAALTAIASVAPSLLLLLPAQRRPHADEQARVLGVRLLLAMAVSALGFFLFSFQVHEKGILFASVAVSLLPARVLPRAAQLAFQLVAAFSMYPLWRKDRLGLVYGAVVALYAAAMLASWALQRRRLGGRLARAVLAVAVAAMAAVHVVQWTWTPPAHLPDLVTLCFTGASFVAFACYYVYLVAALWRHVRQRAPSAAVDDERKRR